MDAGSIDPRAAVDHVRRQLFGHLFVGELGGIEEHIVIQHVVADRHQIHPVAGFRRLQQAALVHVLILKPE